MKTTQFICPVCKTEQPGYHRCYLPVEAPTMKTKKIAADCGITDADEIYHLGQAIAGGIAYTDLSALENDFLHIIEALYRRIEALEAKESCALNACKLLVDYHDNLTPDSVTITDVVRAGVNAIWVKIQEEAEGIQAHPCEVCKGKGWIISLRSSDESGASASDILQVVERCDACAQYENDEEAAKHCGVAHEPTYPCYVKEGA